jgi:type IV secretion system protein TrbI
MPELDRTPSEGIDLEDPVPQGRSSISKRLRYTAYTVFIAIGLAVVGGLTLRLVSKGAEDKAKQTSRFASEAASSDRESVERRQSTGATEPPTSGAPSKAPQPEPVAPSQLPGTPTATHPELVHQANGGEQSTTQQQPQITAEEQARLDAERQAYQEEIAARKAPTSYQAYVSLMSAAQGSAASPAEPPQTPAPIPPVFPSPDAMGVGGQPQEPVDLASLGRKVGLTRNASSPNNYKGQNGQEDKTQFLEGSESPNPTDDYLKATRIDPLSEFEIQQGTVIPAVMPLAVNSDTPGQVTAEIRVDVNDALCGITRKDGSTRCYVLIPHGSKLIGEYNSTVSYGQNRVQVAWTRVIFPDSTSLDLGRMNGHAADGSAGLKDRVDNHWKSKIAGVALTSLLSAGLAVSQNRSNNSVLQYPSTGEVIGASIGQNASQLGQELTQRNFNRQPTLTIRPGQKFLVYVKKDIVFPSPYEPHY